jgi:L-threonylcarbamoyladenylate synthase
MEVIAFYPLNSSHAVELLLDGAVGVLPTDTIYGIVARAQDEHAVAKLYRAKHREGKPGTVVAASISQLEKLGVPLDTLQKVAHLWPGAISIVLPAGEKLAYLDQGKTSLAVRVTKDPALRALLEQTGPLLTSSANMPGEAPATTMQEAEYYFGDTVDFYVDGGDLAGREPSTVARLDLEGNRLDILRQGAVHVENNGELSLRPH